MQIFGTYDVVVVGAGISGVCAAIKAKREGAKTLLVEGSGVLGGLITGGRQTKSTGLVNGGVFQELLNRCVQYKGADPEIRSSYWGKYTGQFDAEVMQRVIVEAVEESGVELLLYAPVTVGGNQGRQAAPGHPHSGQVGAQAHHGEGLHRLLGRRRLGVLGGRAVHDRPEGRRADAAHHLLRPSRQCRFPRGRQGFSGTQG